MDFVRKTSYWDEASGWPQSIVPQGVQLHPQNLFWGFAQNAELILHFVLI